MSGINDMTVKKIEPTIWALEYIKRNYDINLESDIYREVSAMWVDIPYPYGNHDNRIRANKLLKAAIIYTMMQIGKTDEVMRYINRSDYWVFAQFKRSGINQEIFDRVMDNAINYANSIRSCCLVKEK